MKRAGGLQLRTLWAECLAAPHTYTGCGPCSAVCTLWVCLDLLAIASAFVPACMPPLPPLPLLVRMR